MAYGDDTGRSRKLIEENLKLVYRETLEEDVPDRFTKLLDQLRARDKNGTPQAAAKDGENE